MTRYHGCFTYKVLLSIDRGSMRRDLASALVYMCYYIICVRHSFYGILNYCTDYLNIIDFIYLYN